MQFVCCVVIYAEEQACVLRKSSVVNTLFVPFWTDTAVCPAQPIHLYAYLFIKTQTISDLAPHGHTSQPALSPTQIARGAVWRVPTQTSFLPIDPVLTEENGSRHWQFQFHPQDIVQHIVSDCSVCAAVTVCVAHRIQMHMRQGQSIEHDFTSIEISLVYAGDDIKEIGDTSSDAHAVADTNVNLERGADKRAGMYDLKVMFNGAWRRVSDVLALDTYHDLTIIHIRIDK